MELSYGIIHGDLPQIVGSSEQRSVQERERLATEPRSDRSLDGVDAFFACALHMHQPSVPTGAGTAVIGHLEHMFRNPNQGDNHNATVFLDCYRRMARFIKDLVDQGCSPRIMLDYSGNLFWGLVQMGQTDVIDELRSVTLDQKYSRCVEWLGTMWGHAVVPSTPIPDIRLHIEAWQSHFASLFGAEALQRVKGFSPPEMHLPNHPDVCFEYVKALRDCGYTWLLVQEHTVETLEGGGLSGSDRYVPNLLVARNSQGEELTIKALIKTQGSDTKLVAQMQPYYEAKGRGRRRLGAVEVPECVTQIADGENGGVMMNEFPGGYMPVWHEIQQGGSVQGVNGTEYLQLLEAAGVLDEDLPKCQPIGQKLLWDFLSTREVGSVDRAIEELTRDNHAFHMEGGSWTSDRSWVQGYENVLNPMNRLSAQFHEVFDLKVQNDPEVRFSRAYVESLLYLLLLETSCFRYWGQGEWTDYARILYEKGLAALKAGSAM